MKRQKERESYHIYLLLMLSGGLMGSYSYILKGGVFANAETANCLLFGTAIASGDFQRARTLILPITMYVVGAFVSELMLDEMKDRFPISWETLLVGIEAIALFLLGFVPQSAPFSISHVTITFLGSMQFNTFRSLRGEVMTTVFCTNHLRQTGVNLYHAVKEGKGKSEKSVLYHLGMIASFMLGAGLMARLSSLFLEKAIWAVPLILLIVFFSLLSDDLKKA